MYALVSVTDDGCGIRPRTLRQLFTPFSRGETLETMTHGQLSLDDDDIPSPPEDSPSGAGSGAGTGLGLAIVKGLVQSMRGHVFVRSIESVGSEFAYSCELQECAVDEETALHRPDSMLELDADATPG